MSSCFLASWLSSECHKEGPTAGARHEIPSTQRNSTTTDTIHMLVHDHITIGKQMHTNRPSYLRVHSNPLRILYGQNRPYRMRSGKLLLLVYNRVYLR